MSDEVSDMLNKEIITKALSIQNLSLKNSKFEAANQTKVSQLANLKSDLSQTKVYQDVLSDRNVAVREKIREIDENVTEENVKIKHEAKAFFKKLGLKASINVVTPPEYEGNLIELKLQFIENSNFYATFFYDPITEDYDLNLLHPESPQFRQLQEFLRRTKDIQGFLYNFRNLMMRSVMNEN